MKLNLSASLQIEYCQRHLPGAGHEEQHVDKHTLSDTHGAEVKRVLKQELYEKQTCGTCHKPASTTENIAQSCSYGQQECQGQREQSHGKHSTKLHLFYPH